MKQTFNYTNRKKILRKHLELEVFDELGGDNYFIIHRLDLDDYDVPDTANLIIEPYVRGVFQDRINTGTVQGFSPGEQYELDDYFDPLQLLFRFKVIDGDGRILAYADQIRPSNLEGDDSGGDREGILPVELTDNLAQEVWRINFREESVVLELNRNIDRIKYLLRNDTNFAGLIYPQAARTILHHIFIVEQNDFDEIEDDTFWKGKWYRFIKNMYSGPPEIPEELDEVDRNRKISEWIEESIKAFAAEHKFRDRIIVGAT